VESINCEKLLTKCSWLSHNPFYPLFVDEVVNEMIHEDPIVVEFHCTSDLW